MTFNVWMDTDMMAKAKVLVHEIDRKREDLVSSLNRAGYDTVSATDKQDCVKQLRTTRFDAVVLERLFDYRKRGVLDWVHELGTGDAGYVFTFDPPFAYICDFSMRNLAAPHMQPIGDQDIVRRITEMVPKPAGDAVPVRRKR